MILHIRAWSSLSQVKELELKQSVTLWRYTFVQSDKPLGLLVQSVTNY
jgi:hypothetical protein